MASSSLSSLKVLSVCSGSLDLNLAGPLSASLAVGGSWGGWGGGEEGGRVAAPTAGREEPSGEGGRKQVGDRRWTPGLPPGPPTATTMVFWEGGGVKPHRGTSGRLINDMVHDLTSGLSAFAAPPVLFLIINLSKANEKICKKKKK